MDLSNLDSIISLVVLAVTYLIVQPLKVSIEGLQRSIEKFADTMDVVQSKLTTTRIELKEVEQIAKSAQKRCDGLSDRIHEVEQRCVGCVCRKE